MKLCSEKTNLKFRNKKTELRIVKSFGYSNVGKKRLEELGVGEKSVNLVEPNQEHNTSYIV